MITFDINKVKIVPLDDVRPNSWNPKLKDTREYRKIVESIKRDGVKSPVVVRSNDGYEIIDGQQRYTALLELGAKEIVIYDYGQVSDEDAMNETLWWQLQVPFDSTMLAPIVLKLKELNKDLPFELDEIQDLVDLDNFELDSMLKDSDSDSDSQTLSIKLNNEAYEVVMRAIDKAKEDGINEAQAIELICADYLGSV